MGKKRKNSFHFVNKLWYSNNAGCAISQKKNMRTYRQAYGWTTHTHTHSHTQTHTCCEGSMKKVPGDKINLCIRNELRDTQDASAQQQQQDNNNNNYNGTTTTTTTQWAQVVILLKMGNCDKLCNWGNLSLFAHIAAQCHAGMKGERVRHKDREGGGRVCLHFFKNTLCAIRLQCSGGRYWTGCFMPCFIYAKLCFN